eukprot:m.32940 g.32940  ORF g.32940 m.32940 type:complete len:219 (-) comp9822_c0_seq2:157-813(-)
MFSSTFASHLIDECEAFGQWSGGDHKDERIQGGYEPVPTQDIHFKQIGFHTSWKYIIQTYLRPITSYYFPSFALPTKGDSTLDFVVRYRPDKQDYLRPHHDASTVTLNVALNQGGGVEYEGANKQILIANVISYHITNRKKKLLAHNILLPLYRIYLQPLTLTYLHKGGGTRFVRQNCTLRNTTPGWGTLSPGRLTHLHEGLKTTKGTRYILVSFIDQ